MADLETLATFVTAVRTGSFAAAARVLGVTPAMVGRRIHGLEAAYGVTLIERTTRAQRLTEAGTTLLHHVETLLDAAADLDNAMRIAPGPLDGRVRMTGPATLGAHRLAGTIARFSTANPGVTVEAVLSDRRADLIAEGFDFAVRVGDLRDSSMIARRVGTYRLILVAAPAFLAAHGAPAHPHDLSEARCLLNLNMSPRNRWPFVRDGQRVVAEVKGGIQIDNGEALRMATLEGAGIAYMPEELVRDDVAAGRLTRLFSAWETAALPIHIVQPGRRQPRRVAMLIAAISDDLRMSHPV